VTACLKCGHDPAAVVTASWDFDTDREVHSLNEHRGNYAGTRWAYKRDRDAWQWVLKIERIKQRIPTATERRRVTLTRIYSGRQRAFDLDNLAGGMKLVVDAMVREELLMGDGPKEAEIHYAQERSEKSGLRVLLEELS
jgi:hypothetical protein